MAVEVSAQQTRTRVKRTGEPFEGALKPEEKSTSATKGRLPREEGYEERTQEWWEGYDPGMDAGF
jgi:hypothetical protein